MPLPLDRRSVLKCIVAVAASTAFGCSEDDPPVKAGGGTGSATFPQSVASGDPRPDSVVLWTRAVNPDLPDEDVTVALQVALDPDFQQLVLDQQGLTAAAEHGHALKVKVTGLTPRTRYYYRFVHGDGEQRTASPVGRTRTAPDAASDETVRFAVADCQDFAGRYYNAWQRLLQLDEDLDFVIFLGDYIYERPPAQVPEPVASRSVTFSDPASALPVPAVGDQGRLAANSLSNYRDLYQRYRSDPFLQQVHERYPFIIVWDDHEYSDDCWGAHANYTNGREDEDYVERRRNSELAFFEYQPVDVTDAPPGVIDPAAAPRFPDTRIWRGFDFGQRLRLLVTDYRSRRPDHLIPEGAYPAAVAMDEAALQSTGAAASFASDTFAYVDISQPQYERERFILLRAYEALAIQAGLSPADAVSRSAALVQGNLALAYVNPVLTQTGQQPIDPAGKPRGIAWIHMGKRNLFDFVGSRYVVIQPAFDVYAAWHYAATGHSSEDAFGAEQETWLRDAAGGGQTWKVVVSSVSLTSMVWDLSNKQDIPDLSLRNRYYFDVDQWDGFPNKKRELLADLKARAGTNLMFISGDIHASFASVEQGVPAITAPAISSSSILQEASETVANAGFPPGTAIYRYVVTEQANTLREGNPGIAFVDIDAHGFTVIELLADEALVTYHLIPSNEVRVDYSGQPEALAARFTRKTLRVRDGAITDA
ncbi:alkaline phosphatase D family protein [Myxococcaceae bacterium GXIMD 01537]